MYTMHDETLGTKYTTPRRLAWHVTNNPDDPIGVKLGQQFDDLYVKLVSSDTGRLVLLTISGCDASWIIQCYSISRIEDSYN